jgi:hypothetical protein
MRQVICSDTTEWLKTIPELDSVITSLPDKEETDMSFGAWKAWFINTVYEILTKTKNYAIFYQTDRKVNGEVLSKARLLFNAANKAVMPLRWHKIVLRRDAGKIDLFRPTYTHLICFSKALKSGKATPDVFERGEMTYPNAMGTTACEVACQFIKDNSDTKVIYDPFCGQGSVLAMAERFGFDAVGVEILPEQCDKARKLAVNSGSVNNEVVPSSLQ